ncbi:MAG: MBL fold metallo-hydrolase [Syntrophomonadaceae bacterium]|jgi:phosphoribosyl 1,2-cyclic phosphodiesterase
MKNFNYRVVFWGVRGSRPVPGRDTIKFGGNTPCIEIQLGERLLILDAGTGICELGQHLDSALKSVSADIFITHTHWDHIQGLPFFGPIFKAQNRFTLYGPGKESTTFAQLCEFQMRPEFFPVSIQQLGADVQFCQLQGNQILDLKNGIAVKTFSNNHPGGGLSYRIEYNDRTCCYVTDYEHQDPIDNNLIEFVKGADLLVYDSNFTNQEYTGSASVPGKKGWGHSTWQEGIKLVRASGAGQLVLFHHASFRTDEEMEQIEQIAREEYPNLLAAREGMVIDL